MIRQKWITTENFRPIHPLDTKCESGPKWWTIPSSAIQRALLQSQLKYVSKLNAAAKHYVFSRFSRSCLTLLIRSLNKISSKTIQTNQYLTEKEKCGTVVKNKGRNFREQYYSVQPPNLYSLLLTETRSRPINTLSSSYCDKHFLSCEYPWCTSGNILAMRREQSQESCGAAFMKGFF